MNLPSELRYTASHEWVRLEGDVATVGITDHAQSELGEIIYLELPEPGRQVAAGESVAVAESVKAASDIYAPLAGEVVESNPAAASGLVNSDPYGAGWLFRLRVADTAGAEALLTSEAYLQHIGH